MTGDHCCCLLVQMPCTRRQARSFMPSRGGALPYIEIQQKQDKQRVLSTAAKESPFFSS
ncbi:MAG: hypothetical protein ACTSWN_04480 [Promethearchaeota archaeon]